MLFPQLFLGVKLLLRDRAHGAGVSAAAAIQAGVGIDLVLGSALRDGAHGAGISAGTAADASVTDLVSHWYVHLQLNVPLFYHIFLKKQWQFFILSLSAVFRPAHPALWHEKADHRRFCRLFLPDQPVLRYLRHLRPHSDRIFPYHGRGHIPVCHYRCPLGASGYQGTMILFLSSGPIIGPLVFFVGKAGIVLSDNKQ